MWQSGEAAPVRNDAAVTGVTARRADEKDEECVV